jgi:hypothetical protein
MYITYEAVIFTATMRAYLPLFLPFKLLYVYQIIWSPIVICWEFLNASILDYSSLSLCVFRQKGGLKAGAVQCAPMPGLGTWLSFGYFTVCSENPATRLRIPFVKMMIFQGRKIPSSLGITLSRQKFGNIKQLINSIFKVTAWKVSFFHSITI